MTESSEDMALLRAWKAGDRRAGNTLLRRHFATVYGFLATKVDDPKDLAQRTFTACVESIDRFREEASFRTYLLAIARRQLYNHYRSRQRRDRVIEPAQQSAADFGPSPSVVLEQRREQRLVLEALRSLPLEMQILLELQYWEALKHHEIAIVLDIPAGTVKSRLHRARGLLRDAVERLADSPALRESTLSGLDEWAASIKAAVQPQSAATGPE